MYVTRANKDYENGQTIHPILPSMVSDMHNFGAAAKLMMTSAVK